MMQLGPCDVLLGVGAERLTACLPLLLHTRALALLLPLEARTPTAPIVDAQPPRRELPERFRLARTGMLLVDVAGAADEAETPPTAWVMKESLRSIRVLLPRRPGAAGRPR